MKGQYVKLALTALCLFLTSSAGQRRVNYNEDLRCVHRCGQLYEGNLHTTISGRPCRQWRHSDVDYVFGRLSLNEMGSKCRNPDYKEMPYCYVTDTTWEFCFHSKCPDGSVDDNCGVEGFYRFNGSCFKTLAVGVRSIGQARQLCKEITSRAAVRLARLHSPEEMRFVKSLTCLSSVTRGRRAYGNVWSWRDGTTWGIENAQNAWPWCNEYPVDTSTKTCVTLQPDQCFRNVRCNDAEEAYYPACEMGIELGEYTTLPLLGNATWTNAVSRCAAEDGFRLCSLSEICDVDSQDRKIRVSGFPTAGESWVPISDEYKDWAYVGSSSSSSSLCERRTTHYGPGGAFSRDQVICCRKKHDSDDVTLQEPNPVTVYVRSTSTSNRMLYKYSLNKENSLEEILLDKKSWLPLQRHPDDIFSFTLFSHFKQGLTETVIYFCKRNYYLDRLRSSLYQLSRYPCDDPYVLQFYLYGSLYPTRTSTNQLFVTSYSLGNQGSRVSSNPVPCCSYAVRSFSFYANSTNSTFLTRNVSPCSGILRLYDLRGIISSPGYPSLHELNPRKKCRWRIIAPERAVIRLNFTVLRLRSSGNGHAYYKAAKTWERFRLGQGDVFNHDQNCPFEAVVVRTPGSSSMFHYGTFCGAFRPQSFTTIGNVALIELANRRSSSFSRVKFSLRFEALLPPSNLEKLQEDTESLVRTWQRSRDLCAEQGKDLCHSKDICKYGGRPFFGVELGNRYAPVLDEYNDWVQVGNRDGRICQRHNQLSGPPRWGMTDRICEGNSAQNTCPDATSVYCCDKNPDEQLPEAKLVTVTVRSVNFNSIVYNRYLREGIDKIIPGSGWSVYWRRLKFTPQDVGSFQLMSTYAPLFSKVVYFCSIELNRTIGRLSTVYSIWEEPCSENWRFQFYLYASSYKRPGTQAIYVGISNTWPHHSRVTFNGYFSRYGHDNRFTIYGYTAETPPLLLSTTANQRTATARMPLIGITTTTERPITIPINSESRCQNSPPFVVTAPVTITSPHYPQSHPDNLNCMWIVTQSDRDRDDKDVRLRLIVEDIFLEGADRCVSDHLEVSVAEYDSDSGEITDEYYGRRLCGSNHGTPLISGGSFVIRFRSNMFLARRGFRLRVEKIRDTCGGLINKNGASITSPGYPTGYRGGLDCTWQIVAPNAGYSIEIQFIKLHILPSPNCTEDSVRVNFVGSPMERIYCDRIQPSRARLMTSRASIRFVTLERAEGYFTDQGFSAYVYFIPRRGGVVSAGRCGISEVNPFEADGRIVARTVGGNEAVAGSWPWVAMIDGATCGGTLLNERWVLTAGHCIVPGDTPNLDFSIFSPDVSKLTVILGRHIRGRRTSSEQTSKIDRVVMYPDYRQERPRAAGSAFGTHSIPINDIALLRLRSPVRISSTVKPVCLPSSDARAGGTCVVVGWGSRDCKATSRDSRDALWFTQVPVIGSDICNSWPALEGAVTERNMFCAGMATGGVGSCKGDFNGSLVCQAPDGSYEINGIYSWGQNRSAVHQPEIYTRVWYFYDWIIEHIFVDV